MSQSSLYLQIRLMKNDHLSHYSVSSVHDYYLKCINNNMQWSLVHEACILGQILWSSLFLVMVEQSQLLIKHLGCFTECFQCLMFQLQLLQVQTNTCINSPWNRALQTTATTKLQMMDCTLLTCNIYLCSLHTFLHSSVNLHGPRHSQIKITLLTYKYTK